jgi:xanthine/uracil/vitamin C permease (AzgA family)
MCKCIGIVKIVFGLLLLLNAFIWPLWHSLTGWIAWIAILIVIFGVIKLAVPACNECNGRACTCPEPAKKKRR